MNEDFRDLLGALQDAGARFLVMGTRIWRAPLSFGAPMGGLEVSQEDLELPGTVIQIGLPPQRIDILTSVTGLEFDASWDNRTSHRVGQMELPFPGREDLIRNKRATGRTREIADPEILEDGPEA